MVEKSHGPIWRFYEDLVVVVVLQKNKTRWRAKSWLQRGFNLSLEERRRASRIRRRNFFKILFWNIRILRHIHTRNTPIIYENVNKQTSLTNADRYERCCTLLSTDLSEFWRQIPACPKNLLPKNPTSSEIFFPLHKSCSPILFHLSLSLYLPLAPPTLSQPPTEFIYKRFPSLAPRLPLPI